MTLYAIIDKLKMLALKHPNVNSAYEGNIYDIMNANPQQKYASVVLTQQSHTQDDTYDHYGFNLFYVDRLVDDLDTNRVQIQSTGKSMLSNIIKAFCEEFDAECDSINYQTFTERFADECAGVYCTITIDMVKDIYCTEKYWDESWATPLITVRNQNKSVEFTANGTYTIEYDATNYSGLGKVEVEVNVPDLNGSYDDGYSEGKNDGIQEGYADGKQDGYADGKQDGYTEGFDVGKNQGLEEGYVDGKADGFSEGKAEGYTEGKEDGISEQKAKLESISISENGTYTREDGYNEIVVEVPDLNGSYDEGYDAGYSEGVEEGTLNAGAIIAETAQVLNITENGLYTTKYTTHEDLGLTDITGYFDDGTPFYNYAQLTGKIFKTDIMLQTDSSVEIWWKPDFNFSGAYYGDGMFSTLDSLNDFSISFRTPSTGQQIQARIGSEDEIVKHVVENKWYHFILKESGLVMDGETITSNFAGHSATNKHLYINSYNDFNTVGSANGYYGMIKIDGNTFIPTENGFINQTTNTPLEVYQDGGYKFFGVPETESNLIRTVNVNVVPTINPTEYGIRFGNSTFTALPDVFELPQRIENSKLEALFMDATKLTDISCFEGMTEIYFDGTFTSASEAVFSQTFQYCESLADLTPLRNIRITVTDDNFTSFYNTARFRFNYGFLNTVVTDFSPLAHIFDNVTHDYIFEVGGEVFASTALKRFELDWDWSKCTSYYRAFSDKKNIEYIQELDATNVTSGYAPLNLFNLYSDAPNLTYFGGFKNQKLSIDNNNFLAKCPNLTRESCLAIVNNLYDFTGNGEAPTSSQGKLKVHANFLTTLGDDINIALNKGWIVTA